MSMPDMTKLSARPRAFIRSPLGLLAILAASIFVAELLALEVLDRLPPLPPQLAHLLAATILVVLAFPALRAFAFTPLLRQLRAREAAEEQLQEANRTLEQRVRERTAALAESDQSTRLLMDSVAEGFYGVDLQGNCTRVNRSALRMLGYEEEELLGRHIHELIHHTRPDGTPYPAEECRMYQALRDRTECHVDDEVFWRRDGSSFPVEYRSLPTFRDGQLVGAVASFFDVTERQRAEAALRLRDAALEAAANAIFITDRDGQIVWVNSAFTRLTGYSATEAIGQNPRVLKSGLHDRTFYQQMWETILSGQTWAGQVTNRRKDGSVYCEEMTITPVHNHGGGLSHFIAIKQDVTERERAEAALRQSEEKYRALVETTATGFLIVDAQGKVLDANAEYVRLTGHATLAEIAGRSVVEWTAPHDLERNAAAVKQCVERGWTRNLEIDYVNRHGGIIPIEVNATLIGSGGAVRILALCRDITARKQAEATLRESEEKWRHLFNESADGLILAHPETRTFRSANQTICRMLGYGEAELLKLGVADLHPPADLPAVLDGFHRQVRGEGKVAPDLPVVRKDGSVFYADITASIVVVAGERLLLGAFRDVTERRQLQQERERLITELQQALAHVKRLGGLLPICAGCKQIRDDRGYWSQVETYIAEHSEARFSHGLCPLCTEKYFPGLTPGINDTQG
jgi:PAS domain S-box-containing protein